jgi:hypothetical protein
MHAKLLKGHSTQMKVPRMTNKHSARGFGNTSHILQDTKISSDGIMLRENILNEKRKGESRIEKKYRKIGK